VTQRGFVLDLDRCTGCGACVIACTIENSPTEGIAWRAIATYNRQRSPGAPVFHYSLACNHCLEPACMEGCPAAAYTKDPVTGAVLIDQDRCIGCRYCGWVCPYDAPRFDAIGGVMEKCTLCDHRLAEGLEPACVVACPVDALGFEAVESLSAVSRDGFPDTGLGPALRIVGARRHSPPEMTAAPERGRAAVGRRSPGWRAFRGEWSLWAFSSIMTFLVAWFSGAAASGGNVSLPVFTAAGVLALGASALHLGRPARAWRGLLNWRRSWISREALLVTLFLAAACAVTFVGVRSSAAAWTTAIIGFAALFAMDMVYRVPGTTVPAVPHSAMATLTAAFYLGLLLPAPALALPAALAKLGLYLVPRERLVGIGRLLAVVRVVVGLVLPSALLVAGGWPPWLLVATAAVGELIDRAEFYAGLEFLTPDIQIRRDLAHRD
jgi:Fe-S-cluster-containing dehydrogenase component/DMSO reductase anchor subunit